MGKTFGLFACASVVAASVWWASSQQTGQAVLAQIDPGSGIGGPPGFGGPPSEGDAQLQAAQRARISDMMRRAAQMEQRGNLNAAIRFAASADALVRSSGIPLNPQAESPAEFIARLQGKSAPQNGGEPQTGNPFAAASQPSRPAPTVPGTDSPAKQQAQELLRQGRQAFQSGDLLSARELALEAQRIQATWTLFEDNPTQLLDDIERKTNTTTFAAAPFPSESPDAQNMANNPFADPREAANGSSPVESLPQPAESTQPAGNPFAVTGQAPAAPQPNQNDLNKAEAQKLMAAARKDAEAGRFDEAREKLKKAESLKVIYNISDERPALVLRDIARMESEAGQLAQITPGVSSQPSAGDEAKREQAQKLLEEARAAIRSGQFDAAEKKIEQARTLNAPYQQFDDTPELVAELLKRFRPSDPQDVPVFPGFPPVATTSEPVASNEPPAPKSFPPVPQRPAPKAPVIEPQAVPEPERIEAPKVADNAPAEPEVNPFAAAPQTEAPQTEAPLAEAPQVEPVAPPQPIPSQPTSPKPPQPEAQGAFDIANKAPAPPETEPSTIHPDGVVAAELYDRGLKHYYDGRYEEAYDAFLNCYRTGQKMDPYRAQSLQDMLQTLRPIIAQRQAAGDIQQTSGQRRVGPGTGNDFGGIDQAEREQNVKYEKLRSEALNNIFKAERLKEKSPTEALELIDRTMTIVSDADLTEQQLAPLVRQLKMARGEIEAWQKQRAPLLELEERNAKVKDIIVQQRRTEIRIEQELADLVEEYNTLFRQRRYAEAEVIAKEAKELDPENPVTETMFWKARFARRDARNEELKIAKEEGFIRQLDSVEWSAIPIDDTRPFEFPDPKTWEELTKRRSKYGTDNRIRTDKEIQIEKSLIRPISLHFTETPLNEVIKHIAAAAGINVVVDNLGLSEEGILPDQPVTINVDEIRLSSALNLMLEPLHLSYMIQDEVLKITSKVREQGEMKVVTYPVADLVIPIPNFKPSGGTGLVSSGPGHNAYSGPANFSVPAGGSLNPVAQYQVGDNFGGLPPINDPWAGPGLRSDLNGGGSNVDFDTLSDLIISTIEPESWAEAGGGGQVKSYETTLSLVIRQTQQVHEEIRDLLEQLRRLQDLQVTIEVRFVTVADRFFERIGIDFDFNVQDNVEADTVGLTPPPFGTPLGVLGLQGQQNQQGQQAQQGQGAQTGVGGIGGGPGARNMLIMGVPGQVQGQQQGGQQQGQQAQQGQVAQAGGVGGQFLQPGANMNLPALDDWPKNGTIVGLSQPGQFTPDLDIGFQQGSFDLGVPDFGNFQPSAGIEVGMAILTDIEAFFFINAAQADERSNIMFAPKVTMFNGQQATVQSTTQRPFVTSLVPTVGFAAVGFTPQITVLSEGVTMQVLAVISADRRFVRLTVVPNFTNITDVFTFTFSGGGGGGQAGGQANTGVAGQGGFNPIGGQGGGIAGGQVGGQIGVGGIGGGPVAPNALALGLPSQMGGQFGVGGIGGVGGVAGGQVGGIGGVGGGIGGIGGVGGGQVGAQVGGVGGGAAVGATTIQQPVFEVVNVTTTVSVPDGGTVLLGGIKRLREGRNMAGVPILNKIPYISRLFKNTGVGRETESLMLMVTPRIIIQEEEEELLGIPL